MKQREFFDGNWGVRCQECDAHIIDAEIPVVPPRPGLTCAGLFCDFQCLDDFRSGFALDRLMLITLHVRDEEWSEYYAALWGF